MDAPKYPGALVFGRTNRSPGAACTSEARKKSLPKFDKIVEQLAQLPSVSAHDSLRIHIPRALWVIYGVRNRHDVGHIGGDVNPNRADAYFVIGVCDWVLAELVRLTFNCSLVDAQAMVDNLVERNIPIIQDIDGFPKILRTNMTIPERIMAIAYVKGAQSLDIKDLQKWLRPAKNSAIMVALLRLDRDKAFLHRDGDRCRITISGSKYVEDEIGSVLVNK